MKVEIEVAERPNNSIIRQKTGIHPDRKSFSIRLILLDKDDALLCDFDFDNIDEFYCLSSQEIIENIAEEMIKTIKEIPDNEKQSYFNLCNYLNKALTLQEFLKNKYYVVC